MEHEDEVGVPPDDRVQRRLDRVVERREAIERRRALRKGGRRGRGPQPEVVTLDPPFEGFAVAERVRL